MYITDYLKSIPLYQMPSDPKKSAKWIGLATLIASIWGRKAAASVALAGLGVHQTFGPNIQIMNIFDLKGFLIIGVLLGNSFFPIVPTLWINIYVVLCLMVREWNFWSIHTNLSRHTKDLEQHNEELSNYIKTLDEGVNRLEKEVREVLKVAHETSLPQNQVESGILNLRQTINQQIGYLEKRLGSLTNSMRAILDTSYASELVDMAQKAQSELQVANQQHQELTTKHLQLMEELTTFNLQMKTAIEQLESQDGEKLHQIKLLKETYQKLSKYMIKVRVYDSKY